MLKGRCNGCGREASSVAQWRCYYCGEGMGYPRWWLLLRGTLLLLMPLICLTLLAVGDEWLRRLALCVRRSVPGSFGIVLAASLLLLPPPDRALPYSTPGEQRRVALQTMAGGWLMALCMGAALGFLCSANAAPLYLKILAFLLLLGSLALPVCLFIASHALWAIAVIIIFIYMIL